VGSFSRLYTRTVTHLCQTCHREAEGERDVQDIRRHCSYPRDAGSTAYENQQKRAQDLGEQHHQEVEFGDLIHANELLHACKRKSENRFQLRYDPFPE